MPYIKKELREALKPELEALKRKLFNLDGFNSDGRAGILNYLITDLLDTCYGPLSDAKYKDYNEAIGMLECCKLEFYRKAAAPYEDLKERENGKVLDRFFKDPDETKAKFGQRKDPVPKSCVDKVFNIDDLKDSSGVYRGFGVLNSVDESELPPQPKLTNIELLSKYKDVWVLVNKALILPHETCFDIIYFGNDDTLKTGHSGTLKFGAHRSAWSKDGKHMGKSTINDLDFDFAYLFSEGEIEKILHHKLNLSEILKETGRGLSRFNDSESPSGR